MKYSQGKKIEALLFELYPSEQRQGRFVEGLAKHNAVLCEVHGGGCYTIWHKPSFSLWYFDASNGGITRLYKKPKTVTTPN